MANKRILIRRDTTANWQAINPTLGSGELGIEVKPDGSRSMKSGTGSTTWNNLPYLVDSPIQLSMLLSHENDTAAHGASPSPVKNRIPAYGDEGGLKSNKIPLEANDVLRKTELDNLNTAIGGDVSDLQNQINQEVSDRNAAIGTHNTANNAHADIRTLISNEAAAREDAIAQAQLATHTWRPAVQTKDDLPSFSTLNSNLNYLCRVIKDEDEPDNNGVWELIAGEEEWTYFSDNADWIDETELDAALGDKLDKLSAGTNTRAYTHKGGDQGETGVSEYADADTLALRDGDGRINVTAGIMAGHAVNYTQLGQKLDKKQGAADAGKAMVIGDTGDLEPGFSGIVDSVDGVSPADPETSKNVVLSVEMTRAEYDALEDPPGSGLYPSLAGKTVTLKDVYPKNTRRIPRPDYANKESTNRITDNKGIWIADRTGYIQVILGSLRTGQDHIVVSINNQIIISQQLNGNTKVLTPDINAVFPISKGDRIQLTVQAYFGSAGCYFIPIKWVDIEE
jgi:hypothetical protein